ncbi:MAG: tetratricopeptide repeat protein [Chloroflexota bacterium]
MKTAEIPLSRAKVTVPGRRSEVLSRPRLLDRLDELLDKQLVLITAPAGYGKTTLLIDLANNTKMPVCWFSLDALDQDLQRFLAYFIAAIAERYPGFGNQSKAALNSIVAVDSSLENLIITIVNEICEHIPEHFVIILDDYQFVDSVSEIRDFIGRFLKLAGENCHLILASRRLPALPDLPVLVARQQVGGFDLSELAFRPDEIRLLFENGYSVTLSDADVEEIARRTEGWVTGLHLTRLQGTDNVPDLTFTASAVGVDLTDYFDQQVLSQQSPTIRSFLLQTSLLEEFDATLCDSVLGVGDWRTIIKTVRRNNLFTISIGPHEEWTRYHALFREFLQKRIQEESPETMQAVLLRLAEVSEERGDLEKAYHALTQVGDQQALAALVGRAGTPLIENGRILTLSAWLSGLPESLVMLNPRLLLLSGNVSLAEGRVQYGLSLIDRAETMFRARNDMPNVAISLMNRSWAHRLLGAYQPAVTDADEAICLVDGNTNQEDLLAEAYRMKGLALYRLGEIKESETYLDRALVKFIHQRQEKNIPQAQLELGMARRALGDLVSAHVYYEKALNAWQEQGNLMAQANLLNNLGVLYHTRGEYEKAIQTFEKGLDCARRSGYAHLQSFILASQGDVYTDIGDLETAGQIYQRTYDIAVQSANHFLTNYVRISLAGLARQKRDYEQARHLLDNAVDALKKRGSYYELGLHALESGRLYLSSGHPRAAVPDLQAALENFERGGLKAETAWTRLWLAAAMVEVGETESASRMLTAALHSVEGGKLPPSFLATGLQVRGWLAALGEDGRARPPVRSFLEEVDSFQEQLSSMRRRLRRLTSAVSVDEPDLVIRAFGKPQVRRQGRAVTNAQWHSRIVRELFFLLVHLKKPLTKEQIGEILWPGSKPEDLKLRFKNELYRLRRAVGQEAILFDGSGYRFNRDLEIEYDVDTFGASLSRARSTRNADEKLRAYEEAVALVRGPYLEDIDSTWVLPEREQLQQEYLHALLALAELRLDRKDTEAALKTCYYVLAADRTFEEAHRLMMRIYAARGNRTGIVDQYQACREALEDELGVPVSAETEALYQSLTS